ncbi:MAG: GAF domain-containing protein [Deltaproteobacteria bacterium]|nr:GAF domain-containing protein [Deltaproteobacteria bacterium]
MYRFEISDGTTQSHYDLREGDTIVGRAEGCGLVLDNKGVSRQHVRVTVAGSRVHVTDLGSKNGIKINAAPVTGGALHGGDKVEVGPYLLTLEEVTDVGFDLSEDHVEVGRTAERRIADMARQLAVVAPAGGSGSGGWGDSSEEVLPGAGTGDASSSTQMLRLLNQAASSLTGGPNQEAVLNHVMEVVFEHIPAERGFLMLCEPGTGKLIPAAVKHRTPPRVPGRITISKTIAQQVIRTRMAVMTADAATDGRFESRQSIMLNAIRSCMVAPLWNREEVIGVIHVDTSQQGVTFDAKHLDLLCAMANYAAVALERSRLHARAQEEEKKRERLGRYLSPQVTQRILAQEDSASGGLSVPEVREVTVLFSDLVGFTTVAELMPPADLAAMLNAYFTVMAEVIFKYDGTLDKYIGDAIMAVFGAPLTLENHALAAVMAASEMRRALARFNAEHPGWPPLRSRLGINSGRAIAGEIGSPNKREYTVLGDTVNIASRLESGVARPGMLVIGPLTHQYVGGHFRCRPLGPLPLKGKAQQVEAFEVLEDDV